MSKIAFITGIAGQDGSYLSELLLKKDYIVYGIVRRNSILYNSKNIDHLKDRIVLKYGDVNDSVSMYRILNNILIDHDNFSRLEIYNLAAQSHVAVSFDVPDYTIQTNINGALYLLEFIRSQPENIKNKIRFYQASTSELYGEVLENPQKETTPFNPLSPYACAKLNAHYLTKCYRESYKIFSCSGILFNHESPRRGNNFVTKKIVLGLKKYLKEKETKTKDSDASLILGNVFSSRDWGHAEDYVYGMWLMLQTDKPEDYVLSTNENIRVIDFINMVAHELGIELRWINHNKEYDIKAYDKETGFLVMRTDKRYFRPNDVNYLKGDSTNARQKLGWEPKHNIHTIVKDMVKNS
jgi:GDPmannose 4,6-dehydratase